MKVYKTSRVLVAGADGRPQFTTWRNFTEACEPHVMPCKDGMRPRMIEDTEDDESTAGEPSWQPMNDMNAAEDVLIELIDATLNQVTRHKPPRPTKQVRVLRLAPPQHLARALEKRGFITNPLSRQVG